MMDNRDDALPSAESAPAMPSTLPPPPVPRTEPGLPSGRYSHAQPVWQFILLNLCTLTLYQKLSEKDPLLDAGGFFSAGKAEGR